MTRGTRGTAFGPGIGVGLLLFVLAVGGSPLEAQGGGPHGYAAGSGPEGGAAGNRSAVAGPHAPGPAAWAGMGHGMEGAAGANCSLCHAAFVSAGRTTETPRWARSVEPTRTYRMYWSPTMDMREVGPSASSLACLSCHDGTIGRDTPLSLGQDLSNDHPIGILYEPWADPDLRPAEAVLAAGLLLERDEAGYRVECVTCHDPHTRGAPSYLRMSNEGSRLCLTCHIK